MTISLANPNPGHAGPQQYRATGDVGAASRFAECRALAERSSPLTPEELAAFESAKARVRYQDERRQSPQLELEQTENA